MQHVACIDESCPTIEDDVHVAYINDITHMNETYCIHECDVCNLLQTCCMHELVMSHV